jgi:P27 family predicted phage terminase small subunit
VGARGPKKQPTEIAKRTKASKRPVAEVVLAGTRELVAPPAPADLPPEGVELWDTVVAEIYRAGLAQSVDLPALETLCFQWAMAKQARRVLRRQSPFALGAAGQLAEHPAVAIERQASALLLRFMQEYGLTASARASLGLAGLQARSLQQELAAKLGAIELEPGE